MSGHIHSGRKDFQNRNSITMFSAKPASVTIPVDDLPTDDLFVVTRPLFRFGSLFGICPHSGLWKTSLNVSLRYKRKSFLGIVNLIIVVCMGVNVLLNIAGMCRKIMAGETSPIKLAWAIMPPMFYIVGMHTYVHFSNHANELFLILSNWRSTFGMMTYTRDDMKPVWKARFWGAVVMVSAISENIVYHMRQDCSQTNCKYLQVVENPSNLTSLEEYYYREHWNNWCRLPYNPVLTVVLFVVNKLTVVATNYADVVIFTIAWVLASKFQHYYQELAQSMDDHKIVWHQARTDFIALVRLLQQVQNFLSPVIFASYVLLIELISTQIHLGITTDTAKTLMAKVYSVWSLAHLIIRLLLMSVVCSRVADHSGELLLLIERCPADSYNAEVERLERLVSVPMGLGGLGCFRITRPFILSVLYVIFTCEIIFLQTAPAAS